MRDLGQIGSLLYGTYLDAQRRQVSLLAAGMAYFSLFAMVPIVLLVVNFTNIGGFLGTLLVGDEYVYLFPEVVVELIQSIAQQSGDMSTNQRLLLSVTSLLILLYSASGMFYYLRRSIQLMWDVAPDHGYNSWRFLRERLYALFILLVTVVFFTGGVIQHVFSFWASMVGETGSGWYMLTYLLSNKIFGFVVFVLLLAILFRYVTEKRLDWRYLLLGSLVTSLALALGQVGIRIYLLLTNLTSFFGAAGSVIVILIWIYYSMQILLYGAQFTYNLGKHTDS